MGDPLVWVDSQFNFKAFISLVYATADEADAYMFYRCFFVLLPFRFATIIPDNRSRERLNGFS